jgi:hypothetical protein
MGGHFKHIYIPQDHVHKKNDWNEFVYRFKLLLIGIQELIV